MDAFVNWIFSMKNLCQILVLIFLQCSVATFGAQPKFAELKKAADTSSQHKTGYEAKGAATISAAGLDVQPVASASGATGQGAHNSATAMLAATTRALNRKARRAQGVQSVAIATHAEVEKLDGYARALVFAEMKLVIDGSEFSLLKSKLQAYIDIQQFTVYEYYRFARYMELLAMHFSAKRYKNLKDSNAAWLELDPGSMISNRCDDQVIANLVDTKVILELKERAQNFMKFLDNLPQSEQNEHDIFSKSEDIRGIQEYNRLRDNEQYRKDQLQKLNGDNTNNVIWALSTCNFMIQGNGVGSLNGYYLMLLTLDDIEKNIFKNNDHADCVWCLKIKKLEENPQLGARMMRLFEEILPELNKFKERVMVLEISQQQRDLKNKSASMQEARVAEFEDCKAKILLEICNLDMRAMFNRLQQVRIECALLDTYKRAFEIVWTLQGIVTKLDSTNESAFNAMWIGLSKMLRDQMKDSDWNLKVLIPAQERANLFQLLDGALICFKQRSSRRLLEMIARSSVTQNDIQEFIDCGGDIDENDGQFLKWGFPNFVPILLAHGANPKLFDTKDCDKSDPLYKQMADLIDSSKLTYKDPKTMKQLRLHQENTAANKENRKARRARQQKALAMQLPQVESAAAAAQLSMREKYEQMMCEQKKRDEDEKAARLARHQQKQLEKDSKHDKTKSEEVVIDPRSTAVPSAAATSREALASYAHYTISFEQLAKDQIKEIPALQQPINDKLRDFKAGIKTDVKRLADSDLWRLRVSDYRVKFFINDSQKIISIREVKPRKNAYK